MQDITDAHLGEKRKLLKRLAQLNHVYMTSDQDCLDLLSTT
jgi:hypothetical protein